MYQGKLSKRELYYLLKLATSESSFIFDNILYKQIDGVAMGSPLRSTLATLMVLIFMGTNFRGVRTKSRKFVPAKCLDLSKP